MNFDSYVSVRIERTTIAAFYSSHVIVPTDNFLVGPRAVTGCSSTNFQEMGFGPDSELIRIILPTKMEAITENGISTTKKLISAWKLRIGRGSLDTELTMDSPIISKNHAIIYGDANGTYIMDVGSSNGTFVNGLKIELGTSRQLIDSATLRFGPELLSREGLTMSNFPWAYHSAGALESRIERYAKKRTA